MRKRSSKAGTTTTAHETWQARYEDDYVARQKMLPVDLVTQVLSHARNKTLVRKCDVCVGLVFTKGSHHVVLRDTLNGSVSLVRNLLTVGGRLAVHDCN